MFYNTTVSEVKNAREAIKIAKEVIGEAGYDKIKITNTEFDEDDEVWTVDADATDETSIQVTIDAEDGSVVDFTAD